MNAKRRDLRHLILTTYGSDGAASAALALLAFPLAKVQTTSGSRTAETLEAIARQKVTPDAVHLCGVGIYEGLPRVEAALRELKRRHVTVTWYCGRGYLDEFIASLSPVCELRFRLMESNAALVCVELELEDRERADMLLRLAKQFLDKNAARSETDRFWHDLVEASAARFFKYDDRESFLQAVRKLAGEKETTDLDRRAVAIFRRHRVTALPLGSSRVMRELRKKIKRLAPLEEPVLILGESGTGKELTARLLHEAGPRTGKLFVPVNCAILSSSPDLALDRLFGHVSGAYTGASEDRPGAFETADGGTLFLDEVAELPLQAQTQLLRVLEEKSFTPLGSMDARTVNVRIVAATNQDLPAMLRQGRFRLDLYHRINVLPLRVPALRRRRDDMPSIARSVQHQLKLDGYALPLSDEDRAAIDAYDWPGNVRQFINVLKRAAYMKTTVRDALAEEFDLSASVDAEKLALFLPPDTDAARPESEIRLAYMKHVLQLHGGNRRRAAQTLKVAVNTLRNWLDGKAG